MTIEEIAKRAKANHAEFTLLKGEMKEYANSHADLVDSIDDAYRYKANYYQGDITPARLSRVSNKIINQS